MSFAVRVFAVNANHDYRWTVQGLDILMATVTIHCPKCSASLKLADRSMLGRKGKCPKCSHRFVLQEPEEVELTLAEPPAPARPASKAINPPVLKGTSAKWVPDGPKADPGDPPVIPSNSFPTPAADSRRTRQRSTPEIPDPTEINPGVSDTGTAASNRSSAIDPQELPALDVSGDPAIPGFTRLGPEKSVAVGRRRKPKRRNPSMLMITGICTAVIAGTGIAVYLLKDPVNSPAAKTPPIVNQEWQDQKKIDAEANEVATALSPTSGEPIPLRYLPFSPKVLLHIRPAELWSRDNQMREFRATLGNLGAWLQKQIVDITTFEPAEIEELTIAVVLGARTSAPEIYTVFRLTEEQTPDVYRRFNGRMRKDLDEEVYEADVYSYMMIDRRTFSAAPVAVSDALAAAKKYPAMAPVELDALLRASDRTRHMTLMFDVSSIDVHREYIFIEQLQRLADQFVVWLGKDVSSLSFSLHLQPNTYIETLMHQSNESSPSRVQKSMKAQLSRLPDDVMSGVRIMTPQTEGTRQIIGRYPAMLRALEMATTVDADGQFARLVTLLPDRAAPNLAAATLLTWNQSLLTDMSLTATTPKTNEPKLPDKVADRLQMPVLVDFRNFPLQEAVAYIGEEIKTEFIIDGDALKGAGFTQNMSQTFNLGTVPALKAIDSILQKYAAERDPMVIHVDEANKKITLLTRSKAQASGMAEFPTN